MTTRWSVSDVKERQVDVWRPFKDRFGITDGFFRFAMHCYETSRVSTLCAQSQRSGRTACIHETNWGPLFARQRRVACEMGFSKIDDGG